METLNAPLLKQRREYFSNHQDDGGEERNLINSRTEDDSRQKFPRDDDGGPSGLKILSIMSGLVWSRLVAR